MDLGGGGRPAADRSQKYATAPAPVTDTSSSGRNSPPRRGVGFGENTITWDRGDTVEEGTPHQHHHHHQPWPQRRRGVWGRAEAATATKTTKAGGGTHGRHPGT